MLRIHSTLTIVQCRPVELVLLAGQILRGLGHHSVGGTAVAPVAAVLGARRRRAQLVLLHDARTGNVVQPQQLGHVVDSGREAEAVSVAMVAQPTGCGACGCFAGIRQLCLRALLRFRECVGCDGRKRTHAVGIHAQSRRTHGLLNRCFTTRLRDYAQNTKKRSHTCKHTHTQHS